MKILHILSFSLLASLLSTAAPSPLTPLPREQPQWWRKQYEQQVEQIKNNPCGVLFVTAQDSCDMRDRLLRYFATCGQEKPLSGNLKRGEKTPENG